MRRDVRICTAQKEQEDSQSSPVLLLLQTRLGQCGQVLERRVSIEDFLNGIHFDDALVGQLGAYH